MKQVQKLTGKLTQKIRTLDNEEGMTSEDVKYVINMVLSSLDLTSLSEEDKKAVDSLETTEAQQKIYDKYESDVKNKIRQELYKDYADSNVISKQSLDDEINKWIDYIF